MGSVIMPSPGVSPLDQTFSSLLSAPNMQSALENASPGDLVQISAEAVQLQEANGLFGNPGAANPLVSALDPGAPNINPSNSLEALDALLLGFTPTSSVVPPPAVGAGTSAAPSTLPASSADAQLVGALFGVGTAAGLANPTVNLLA
jgi:hypothetical protein